MKQDRKNKRGIQCDARGMLVVILSGLLISTAGCSAARFRQLFSGCVSGPCVEEPQPSYDAGLETETEQPVATSGDHGNDLDSEPELSLMMAPDPFLVAEALQNDQSEQIAPPSSADEQNSLIAATPSRAAVLFPDESRLRVQQVDHLQHLAELDHLLQQSAAKPATAEGYRHFGAVQQSDAAEVTSSTDGLELFDSMLATSQHNTAIRSGLPGSPADLTVASSVTHTRWIEGANSTDTSPVRLMGARRADDTELPDLTTLEDLLSQPAEPAITQHQIETEPQSPVPPVPTTPIPPIPSMKSASLKTTENEDAGETGHLPAAAVSQRHESALQPEQPPIEEVSQGDSTEERFADTVTTETVTRPRASEESWSMERDSIPAASVSETHVLPRRLATLSASMVRSLPAPAALQDLPVKKQQPAAEVDLVRTIMAQPPRTSELAAGRETPVPEEMAPVPPQAHSTVDPGAVSESISNRTWALIAVCGLILMGLYLPVRRNELNVAAGGPSSGSDATV